MDIKELNKKLENGDPVSVKDAVLAICIGYDNHIPSVESYEEKLTNLNSKLIEAKDKYQDLTSGCGAEALKKKYSRTRYDEYYNCYRMFKHLTQYPQIFSLDLFVIQLKNLFMMTPDEWDSAEEWLAYETLYTESLIKSLEVRILLTKNEQRHCRKKTDELFKILEQLPDEMIK